MNREEIAPEPRPDAALPAGFDPQHAEAILCVVERDSVDQDLRQACHRYPRMPVMMKIEFQERCRNQPEKYIFHRSRVRARNNSLDKNTAHLYSPAAAGHGWLFYREPHRYQPPPKPKTTSARQASCAYISDSNMKSLALDTKKRSQQFGGRLQQPDPPKAGAY
ncbi:MAG TPA: hypothetical protein VNZ53_07095 [Steroidobacteraceae bacterium]|nr:hypothetical protein [Steroidobacteraceae bacterium]